MNIVLETNLDKTLHDTVFDKLTNKSYDKELTKDEQTKVILKFVKDVIEKEKK